MFRLALAVAQLTQLTQVIRVIKVVEVIKVIKDGIVGSRRVVRDTLMARRVPSCLLAAGLALASCSGRADAREEARTLMTSLNAVSDEGTFTERSAALERLSRLRLRFASHVRTREVCSAAHKGLLEAEVAQAEARRALSDASQDGPDGPLAQSKAASIAADIARSNKALATAKQRFPECERAMRNLVQEAH